MKTAAILTGGIVLAGALATPAAAADKVPVKLRLKGCDGCEVSATWSRTGKITGEYNGTSKTVSGDNATLTFRVPKGYYVYFAGTSPRAAVDAATLLVTQFKGRSQGDEVSASQLPGLTKGAHYCMVAEKTTVKARASLVPDGSVDLLALWASPQLGKLGPKLTDGIKGVYGTQNTLPCAK